MGLTEERFWRLTPGKFFGLLRRLSQGREAEDFRTGIIASTIANVHRKKGTRPYKPEDFMPKYEDSSSKKSKKKQMSGQQMKAMAFHLTKLMGGTVTGDIGKVFSAESHGP